MPLRSHIHTSGVLTPYGTAYIQGLTRYHDPQKLYPYFWSVNNLTVSLYPQAE